MKKVAVLLLILLILCNTSAAFAAELTIDDLEEKGIYIYELSSETPVYAKDEQKRFYPASITKIVTALCALDYADINERITIGEEIFEIDSDSSVSDLIVGESMTLKELLYGLLLPSGNDAANTIAVHIAEKLGQNGTTYSKIAFFADLMNEKASSLGAVDSHFVNPHGLHDDEHYTTPYDVYLFGRAAIENETLAEIVSQSFCYVTTEKADHEWLNSNMLLQPSYDPIPYTDKTGPNPTYMSEVLGIKTGNTEEAGRTIVTYSKFGGMQIITVVLKSTKEDLFIDAKATIEHVTDNYTLRTYANYGEIYDTFHILNNASDDAKTLAVTPEKDAVYLAPKATAEDLVLAVSYDESIFGRLFNEQYILKKDIDSKEAVGTLTLSNAEGTVVFETRLIAVNPVQADQYFIHRILAVFGVLIVILFALFRQIKKKKRA